MGNAALPPSEPSQVVKIVPQRRDHPTTSTASTAVTTQPGKPVDHVLSLLKAKQEQEVEALRRRQQQEVQQCLQQLHGVTTDQLATLLAPPTPLEAPQKVKVGGQVMVVANATFSLEQSSATPPNILPLFINRDSNDTNNNTVTNCGGNNNYKPPATATPSPPPASLPPAMEYYRLCTPEDEYDKFEAELSQDPNVTLQPGLFRVLGAGEAYTTSKPTTITSLLATHPEVFAEGGQRVQGGQRRQGMAGEAGLDMVPQREFEIGMSRKMPVHPLASHPVFLKGLVRLQASVRRWLTARLLRTRLVQEQVATLAEIAKLARQFHRDIVADNLHRGDVELHKALYKQEGLARERIWRIFIGLSVQEKMSLLRHDRKLTLAGVEQRPTPAPVTAPTPATAPAALHHHPHHHHANRSVSGKRPSPAPPPAPHKKQGGLEL
ncbi:uncharacterized protein LOC123502291 isoform X3 [Portunus trituberculatus]|uniref:uncharacterized protein LOC123502291 isoform X3 n=1 Tax=Portunus trituberculatus TaxID=210409 RepID=UPI001E1CF1D8|nr:uncharacterized protein LOC123502291 isoform X3 [Portunus trituberculatus]